MMNMYSALAAMIMVPFLALAAPLSGEDCEEVCLAGPSYDPTGEPPGLIVLIGVGQDGAADEFCNTCPDKRCKLSVSAQWAPPTGSTNCFVWRKPPTSPGWSTPHKHYSRTGNITQGCNSTSAGVMQVGFVNCSNPGTPSGVRTVTLSCLCDPGE